MLSLSRLHFDEVLSHAYEENPKECCGLIGRKGAGDLTVYRLRNLAIDPRTAYEAAPEDLFAAQRQMRDRGEQLLGIYHSHPCSSEPAPSETDIRLAYYPQAVYFIIGLAGPCPVMRAFRISERQERWEEVEYAIADE